MHLLRARVEAHPPQRRELVQALLRWAETARQQESAHACYLYEDLESPGVFGLVAEWRTEAAFEAHLRSEPFGVLQGALEVLARPVRFEALTSTESSIPAPGGRAR